MAKIDVSKIDGYESMTAEEKLAALEGFEYNDNAAELEKAKKAVTKANGEAAEWKRKHSELLSEEERNRLARDEEFNQLKSEVETLRADKALSEHKARLVALGYDSDLAEAGAKALAEGDHAAFFEHQKKFLESHDKAVEADLLKRTPTPPPGNGGNPEVDYSKKAADAQAAGNYSEAAYYMRLAQETKKE